MPSTLNITRDAEDRIVGLSGDFSKWTNANGDDDHFAPEAVLLTVPENTVAHLTATLTVDDWGYIDIIPPIGAPIRVLDLSPNAGSPGPRGGHVRWGASTGIPYVLQSGTYTIVVRQDNAPYSEAYSSEAGSNISFCHVAIAVEYTETDRMIRILSSDEYAEIEETGTNVAGYIKTNDKVVNGHHAISVGLEYSGPSGDTSFNPTPKAQDSVINSNQRASPTILLQVGLASRCILWLTIRKQLSSHLTVRLPVRSNTSRLSLRTNLR